MRCPHCGEDHPNTAKYCMNCGKKIESFGDFVICQNPECDYRQPLPANTRFCPNCGTELSSNSNSNFVKNLSKDFTSLIVVERDDCPLEYRMIKISKEDNGLGYDFYIGETLLTIPLLFGIFCQSDNKGQPFPRPYFRSQVEESTFKDIISNEYSIPLYYGGYTIAKLAINLFNERFKLNLRLPKESEWLSAFNGPNDKGFRFAGSDNFENVAWVKQNSHDTIHRVAQKKSNGYGLYDMSGLLSELCIHDRYCEDSFYIGDFERGEIVTIGGSYGQHYDWSWKPISVQKTNLDIDVKRVCNVGFRLVFTK